MTLKTNLKFKYLPFILISFSDIYFLMIQKAYNRKLLFIESNRRDIATPRAVLADEYTRQFETGYCRKQLLFDSDHVHRIWVPGLPREFRANIVNWPRGNSFPLARATILLLPLISVWWERPHCVLMLFWKFIRLYVLKFSVEVFAAEVKDRTKTSELIRWRSSVRVCTGKSFLHILLLVNFEILLLPIFFFLQKS